MLRAVPHNIHPHESGGTIASTATVSALDGSHEMLIANYEELFFVVSVQHGGKKKRREGGRVVARQAATSFIIIF